MRLKNKKTREIVDFKTPLCMCDDKSSWQYDSLSELEEDWEDYEEPTTYYYISDFGAIREGDVGKFVEDEIVRKEIGNYFGTKEKAEKAVEKLKAWKRLKDKGFMITLQGCKGNAWLQANWGNLQGDYSDVLLLFGGEK